MSKPIIFLDLEGTLIDVPRIIPTVIPKSMWQSLAQKLGPDCLEEEEKSHHRWLRGEIPNYVTWMKETIELFVKHGLCETDIDDLVAAVKPRPGIGVFAERMHAQGAVIAIVTGALKEIAEPIQIQMRADHLFAGCELYFSNNGKVNHYNLIPSDWHGKVDFMNLLVQEYKTENKSCAFVGDGANDVFLARNVGFSIAYNADPILIEASDMHVEQDPDSCDFSELCEMIENFWSDI